MTMTKNERIVFGSFIAALIVLFAAAVIGMPVLIGYSRNQDRDRALVYRTFGGWTYRRIADTRDIAIVSINNPDAISGTGRILTIPAELNGRRVVQLGDLARADSDTPRRQFVQISARANRIVIPEGIHVDPIFWQELNRMTEYVEFLDAAPGIMELSRDFASRVITIIVPDSRGIAYRQIFEEAYVIERSQFNPHPVWRYYQINQTEAVITRLRDLNVGSGQTLIIPTEINGLTVTRLGATEEIGGGQIFFTRGDRISRVIIPEGVFVERTFWRGFYLTDRVEMQSNDPAYLARGSQVGLAGRILVVPYGRREAYLEWLEWSRWLNIEESEE